MVKKLKSFQWETVPDMRVDPYGYRLSGISLEWEDGTTDFVEGGLQVQRHPVTHLIKDGWLGKYSELGDGMFHFVPTIPILMKEVVYGEEWTLERVSEEQGHPNLMIVAVLHRDGDWGCFAVKDRGKTRNRFLNMGS